MVSFPGNPSTPTGWKNRSYSDEIFVAATPLRATRGPAQLLMSAAFSLKLWHLQHFMLIIKPSPRTTPTTTPLSDPHALVFDFQPQDPENIYVALAALTGKAVPGIILERKISKLPKNRCWFIGLSKTDSLEVVYDFNRRWQTDLTIGQRDCRHYTNGLAAVLTGEENVLERLKTTTPHQ